LQTEKSNSFFGQSIYIFLIRFFPVLANVLVFIYYGRVLDTAANGKYISFWAQLPLLTAVACAGINVLLPTYSLSNIVKLLRKLSRIQLLLYIVWVLAAAFMFAAMQTYSGYAGFVTAFLFLAVNTVTIIAETFLVVARHFRSVALINIAYSAIFCFLHWYVLRYEVGFDKLFTALLFLSVIRLMLYIMFVVKKFAKHNIPAEEEIPINEVRSLWLHLAFYDISQLTFKWIDKILISLILTASFSAIYFYGTYDIPFLPVILSAVGSTALINLAQRGGDDKYSANVMLHSMHILSSLVFPMFFFLLFFRYELFDIVFDGKYAASVPVFLAALLVVPLRACNFTVILQNRHKGKIINTGAVFDLVLACVLMYPFYLLWGLPGIAFAFTFTTYLQAAYYLYHTARVLKTRFIDLLPYRNWLIKLIAFCLLFALLHEVLASYCKQVVVLMAGGIVMVTAILATLRFELKRNKEF